MRTFSGCLHTPFSSTRFTNAGTTGFLNKRIRRRKKKPQPPLKNTSCTAHSLKAHLRCYFKPAVRSRRMRQLPAFAQQEKHVRLDFVFSTCVSVLSFLFARRASDRSRPWSLMLPHERTEGYPHARADTHALTRRHREVRRLPSVRERRDPSARGLRRKRENERWEKGSGRRRGEGVVREVAGEGEGTPLLLAPRFPSTSPPAVTTSAAGFPGTSRKERSIRMGV